MDALAACNEILAACKGKDPAPQKVQTGEKDDGTPVFGEWRDLAEVHPRDVVTLCDLVPIDDRSQVVKDLRKGCARQAADKNRTRPVRIQVCDALALLEAAEAHLPAKPGE